jgi:hypothetical protein
MHADLQGNIAAEIAVLVETLSPELRPLRDADARRKPAPDKWSIAQILGHMVDSAANNHQRFVRAQHVSQKGRPGAGYQGPGYEQEDWVARQGYQDAPWPELVELWRLYNLHLSRVILRIPDESLATEMHIGDYEPATLAFVVEDYLAHMRHHVAQIRGLLNAPR